MTGQHASALALAKRPGLRIAGLAMVLCAASACVSYYEVSVETPIRARLDVSNFDRVLVAGFIAGGSRDVDGNLETTRLLRSQLRTRSDLRVVDADVLPLIDEAVSRAKIEQVALSDNTEEIREVADFEPYKAIFSDAEFWQEVGRRHDQPLIVTGTILFVAQESSQVVNQQDEQIDELGRRSNESRQALVPRRGFILEPDFIFIDGRTGAVLHSEPFREAVYYPGNNPTPALSSYFELMDRVLPGFLNTFSSQTIRGTRVLLR